MLRTERYHELDALRAFAMFLGIVIHGVLPYTSKPVPFWPVHDCKTTPLAEMGVFTIHNFRLQLFFLLSGFFGALICSRYGLKTFLKHRFLRVFLPLTLGVLLLNPILQYLWLIGDPHSLKFLGLTDADTPQKIREVFTSGRFLLSAKPIHLWFLYYLCILCLMIAPFIVLGRMPFGQAVFEKLRVMQGFFLTRWFGLPILGIALLPLLWQMKLLAVDTPEGWEPNWNLLVYYFIFFSFGWILFSDRQLLEKASQYWRIQLGIGVIVLLPLYGLTAKEGYERIIEHRTDNADFERVKLATQLLGGVQTWLMIFGMIGLFRRYFSHPRQWGRYLADSSYWCYIASLPPLIALQMLVAEWDVPLVFKLVFVHGVAIGSLLLSYEYLVRYTFIGALLNGRKHRVSDSGERGA